MGCALLSLQPFAFVENNMFWRHFKYDSISQNKFLSYVKKMTTHFENKIQEAFPDPYPVLSGGWTTNNTHYVGVIATFPSEDTYLFDQGLPAISPMEDKTTQHAKEHFAFLDFALSVFDRTVSNVLG